MSEPLNPEVAILNAALELPPAQRAAYLDQACAGDAALRRQVEALLQADDKAQSFLEALPPVLAFTQSDLRQLPLTEKPGDKIGRYKLLQKIGEGGCGVVYMAEQEEPVRRRVALKVIKLGMDTKEFVARFEAERQALALMDHPNIAKVFDAGATDTGRPYFVMELVRGIKITQFCDENKLSTAERLKLFILVCQAIQHAHQKGVIHRDIKPSNILVIVNDRVPVPKVIDFGIAKATAGRLTDQTLFTAFEQFIGTPAYMSPEQAVMTSLDIDTRSDIYSLGVLLYQLLTGRTPFDGQELLKAGLDEMRRVIREVEPVKPSTRLTQQRLSMGVASSGKSAIRNAQSAVDKDLDWIVMKALEKDRARRYETAIGLAEDIQRYLNNEPVLARSPRKLYRLQKLARRNKAGFAAASIALLALVLGLATSTWAFARERSARERATKEAVRSRQVAEFLKEMVKGVDPALAGGRGTTMLREILDAAAERVGKDLQGYSDVQAELYRALAEAYNSFQEAAKEEAMYRLALERTRQFYGQQHTNTALAMQELACRLYNSDQYDEAEKLLQDALAIYRASFGDQHPTVAKVYVDMSFACRAREDWNGAETLLREAIAIERRFYGRDTEQAARWLYTLGNAVEDRGDLPEAERIQREAWQMKRKVLGDTHLETIESLTMVADLARQRGELAEAEALHRKAVALRKEYYGETHRRFPHALYLLSALLEERGELVEAEALARQAFGLAKMRWGEELQGTDWFRRHLAAILQKRGQWTEAEALRRQSLAVARTCSTDDPEISLGHRSYKLAEVLHRQGKSGEAEPFFHEAETRLLQAVEKHVKSGKVHSGHIRDAFELLVGLYETWDAAAPNTGKDSQAAGWRQKLVDLNQVQAEKKKAALEKQEAQ